MADLRIPETAHEMIVDHSGGLHVRVNDRRSYEPEPTLLEILAERIGFGRGRRNLAGRFPPVQLWPAIDEPPAVRIETAKLFLNGEKFLRVPNCGFDFHPVSNDRGVRQDFFDPLRRKTRHFIRIEAAKRPTVTFSFIQNGRPTEPGLRTFQHQKFKMPSVVVDRDAPFAVVIGKHQRVVGPNPGTSFPIHNVLDHTISKAVPEMADGSQREMNRAVGCACSYIPLASSSLRSYVPFVPK